jgi:outer membrane protein OmpA-like peptidoglycan-associated protein
MKRISICFVTISILFLSISGLAQERKIKTLSKHKRHKIAHDLIKRGSYYNASSQLEELVKTYPAEKEFVFRLGQSYLASRDYVNAENWLKKAYEMDSANIDLALFHYAEALKYNAKYVAAKNAFSKFYNSKYKEEKNGQYKTIAKNEIGACEFAEKEKSSPAYNSIKHLGDNINCGYTDFSPTPKGGDTLFFASMQSDSVIYHHHEDAHFKHVKLYTSTKQAGEWATPKELASINSKIQNTANGAFSPDGKKFYYTLCNLDRKHKMNCQILVSEVNTSGDLGKGEPLKGLINSDGYTFTQPFPFYLGTGKSKTNAIMFVSDIPGGKGGLDIWYSTQDKNGDWKKPTNLGSQVNTIRDEITPFYDIANGNLYFSSNFHYGFGGYDIFRAKGQISKFDKPINLGMPINSRVDDTYFTIFGAKENGYLVSNRPGGTHLLSETCCDDIYSHQYEPISLVAVRIFNKKANNTRMEGAKLKMLTPTNTSGKSMISLDSTGFKNVNFDSVATTYANKNPMQINTSEFQYFYRVIPSKDYVLAVNVPGSDSENVLIGNTDGKLGLIKSIADSIVKTEFKHSNQADVLLVDMYLSPGMGTKNIVTPPVVKVADVSEYTVSKAFKDGKLKDKTAEIDLRIVLNFDFSDTEFLKGKEEALDSLIMILKDYPELMVDISAHTDNVGTHEFNMDLSKKRATTIENYLSGKGVNKKRLKSKGFGETVPLSPNENPDGSDNPDARAVNRRAEITLMRHFNKSNGGNKKK